ncbi:MAG: murein biosynthesis integral membrane protein MurJ [Candidatus Omnitrophica bacterium]|nr:murein biosynthesis integral membrane protein MurJ [Candidatus Omnitrophota bacterium]
MSKKSLIKSASIISLGTFASRMLGFLRDILMAKVFGTGWLAQAFFVAFRIPNMFRELAAEGASNAALVPVFSEYLATKKRQDFWNLVNTAFIAFVIIVGIIVLFGAIFSPFLVRIVAPGFVEMPEKLNLTTQINRPLFAYLFLVAIAGFAMAVLHTFKSFLSPAFSPCIFNIVLILGIVLADNSTAGIWKLVWAVIIAGFLQIAVQLPAMLRNGFKFKPFDFEKKIFSHPGVKLIGRLLAPRILGVAVYQLNILIDTIFASLSFFVQEGSIAAIYYASRLIQFPLGLFGHSVSNASLPTLSEFAAKKEMNKFAETVEFGLTNILFVMIPATFGLIVMAQPLIKIMFERGQFNANSTMVTSIALAFYAVGLCGYGANKFLALCFNALQNTITPVKVSSFSLLTNIVFNILFVVVLKTKVAGLAFASSLSAIIASFILYRSLHKRIKEINSRNILTETIKMFLAGIIMSLVIFIIWQGLIYLVNPLISLCITIFCSVAVYIIVCFYLKVYQATHLFKWILKRK